MVCDRCNYFSFWAIFCPLTPPSLPNSLKNQNSEKMKKPAGDIIILHMCTKNCDGNFAGSMYVLVCPKKLWICYCSVQKMLTALFKLGFGDTPLQYTKNVDTFI